jgi:hypothetical protein
MFNTMMITLHATLALALDDNPINKESQTENRRMSVLLPVA